MNDYLTTEARTLDTISRNLSSVINDLPKQGSLDADAVLAIWERLYEIRNRAMDAVMSEMEPDPPASIAPIQHPQMTPKWFDEAVHRAMCAGCRVIETKRPGILFVTSGTVDNLTYRVTRTECSCKGHLHTGRCYHRALACAYADVFRPNERVAQMPQEAA